MDMLSPIFLRYSLRAKVFFSGTLCGVSAMESEPGLGSLHVLRAGELLVTNDGETPFRITEPTLLFYPQSRRHCFQAERDAKLVCALIDFGGNIGNPLLFGLPKVLMLPLRTVPGIDATLDLLFDEAFQARAGRQAALDRLVEYFLILLLRHSMEEGSMDGGIFAAMAEPRLAKAVNAMHEKPEEPWTVEQLAQLAGMSRARFAAHFHAVSGHTPLGYLTDWRLGVAKTLIKTGKSLKLIAPQVGYASVVALNRVFAQRHGQTLGEWSATQKESAAGRAESEK